MKTKDSIPGPVQSRRIIHTPSPFARTSLLHLQEAGTLQALAPHRSERSGMASCLFFLVLSGCGKLRCEEGEYELQKGDCVFLDCRKGMAPCGIRTGPTLWPPVTAFFWTAGSLTAMKRAALRRDWSRRSPLPLSGPCSGAISTGRT